MGVFTRRLLTVIALGLALPVSASAATLRLSPSSGSFSVGSTFTVGIILDTAGAVVQGVDVDGLNYNPSLLGVLDDNPSQSGVQIAAGALMPVTVANAVDAAAGRILFSQLTAGGTNFSGSGTLAQIRFLVKAAGTANATFNFTPGSTADSNVASSGQDVLTSVANGSYTLTSGAVSPTPIPSPTSSPTPAPLPRITPPIVPGPGVPAATTAPRPRRPVSSPPAAEPAVSPKPSPVATTTPLAEKIREKIRDPFFIYAVAVASLFFILIVSTLVKFARAGAASSRVARNQRIRGITDFIVTGFSKRRSREEIEKELLQSNVPRNEINEAFRRLKLK